MKLVSEIYWLMSCILIKWPLLCGNDTSSHTAVQGFIVCNRFSAGSEIVGFEKREPRVNRQLHELILLSHMHFFVTLCLWFHSSQHYQSKKQKRNNKRTWQNSSTAVSLRHWFNRKHKAHTRVEVTCLWHTKGRKMWFCFCSVTERDKKMS